MGREKRYGMEIIMTQNTILLLFIATASFCFGLLNCIQLLRNRTHTTKTTGTILSVKIVNPETAKTRNSKWAVLTYRVNGKNYQSENSIQVPMTAEIGSKIPIRCNTAHPETLYHFSWKRVVGGFAVAILCVTLSLFVK